MKIYMLRHQAAGYLTEYLFSERPTDVQVAAVKRICDRSHGKVSPNSGQPYWLIPVERDLLDASFVPQLEEPRGASTAAELPEFGVSGVGTVSPPSEA